MKNKGFTLVEILAVIVILGIITTMASLAVIRYRKEADKKDLLNLHDALQTSFANYRTVLAMSGDVFTGPTLTISSSQFSDFDKYIQDLSYNGRRLGKSNLNGTTITLRKKGDILSNETYKTKGEEQFIKDATCIVTSEVINPEQSGAKITKHCKKDNRGNIMPSQDELICIKVNYSPTSDGSDSSIVIDDYGKTDYALSFNELCTYLG